MNVNLRFNIRGQNKCNSKGFNKETAHTWLKAFKKKIESHHINTNIKKPHSFVHVTLETKKIYDNITIMKDTW